MLMALMKETSLICQRDCFDGEVKGSYDGDDLGAADGDELGLLDGDALG